MCYEYKVLRDTKRTWADSRAECQRAGGDLASIKTSEEWQFVKDSNILLFIFLFFRAKLKLFNIKELGKNFPLSEIDRLIFYV